MSAAMLEAKMPPTNGVASDVLYEVINGRIVELPPMGALEMNLSNLLSYYLWESLPKPWPGQVFIEMLFQLAANSLRDRRPDVAYVPYTRFPKRIVPYGEAWAVIPALAVEIVSRSNTASEIRGKIDDYFRYGVELVWVVYPEQRKVDVWTSATTATSLTESDTLD